MKTAARTSDEIASAQLAKLFTDTGIDVAALAPVANAREVAAILGMSVDALAQDRYRGNGIPYIKVGRRVRYLRADVARYLVAHRNGVSTVAP